MRLPAALIVLVVLMMGGCWRSDHSRKEAGSRGATPEDKNSAAFKAGKMAHKLANETGKAAAAAGRKLQESAHKAHEGWKEQSKEDRERRR
jgi:hypothetical protein